MPGSILLTRPRADCERLATMLTQHDLPCLIAPMLRIAPIADATTQIAHHLPDTHALIITSRHALPALSAVKQCLRLPLFMVGERTAEEAAHYGFSALHPAAENVHILLSQLRAARTPGQRPLLYVSGRHISTGIDTLLQAEGVMVNRVTAYEAQAAETLCEDVKEALRQEQIRIAVFYSLRTLEIFSQHIIAAGLQTTLRHITACCLSDRIASHAHTLPWKQIRTTKEAHESSMLELLMNSAGHNSSSAL